MAESQPSIAVVIPAYRVASLIEYVLTRVPEQVSHIIVVDDASPDNLQEVLGKIADPRLIVLRHATNRGVGGAMKSAFVKALELGTDIIVKIDGDKQMDPSLLPDFIRPIVSGNADLTKGNRFVDLRFIQRMPLVRRFGNLALSFLVKAASGYWRVFDPCNGYLAIRTSLLKSFMFDRIDDRYFFEISFICEAYFSGAVLRDVPMLPVYGDEPSSLSPMGVIKDFIPKLVWRAMHRIFLSYFMLDFNVVSVFMVAGVPTFAFGVLWSVYHWIQSYRLQSLASTGTIMIGVLALVLGFQLILNAIVLDVQNDPGRRRQ
jgi:dolichol-phosphate mannosyltransferase